VELGRGRRFSTSDLQRTAVDFGELQSFAVHFGKDYGGLWQGKPLYFKGTHCSRLWKLTVEPLNVRRPTDPAVLPHPRGP
jgi:hypothetical protein